MEPQTVPLLVAAEGKPLEVAAGQLLFTRGEPADRLFLIESGQVELVLTAEGEDAELQLAVLGEGELVGETAVLEGGVRSTGARALLDCRLRVLDRAAFSRYLRESPEAALELLRRMSLRVRGLENRLWVMWKLRAQAAAEATAETTARPLARLVNLEAGLEFRLSDADEITIGRPDAEFGTVPDIDLSPLNTERSVSRRHAKILRHGSRYFVVRELDAVNPAWVKGEEIEMGLPVEIHDGDQISIGAVNLIFRLG